MTAAVEDTIVQILDQKGDWIDYARTTRPEALAAVAAGHLPNNTRPEPIRAVDWITHEEIAMTDKTETAAPATLTAPEAAKKIGTDGKSFRRFLRSDASPISAVGQGARYAIDPKDLPALKKGFAKFQAEQEAKRAARAEAKAKSEPETDEDSENEVDEEPKPERTEDMVDKVQAAGGLPKAEQVKANARKTRKAASEAARKPETATA